MQGPSASVAAGFAGPESAGLAGGELADYGAGRAGAAGLRAGWFGTARAFGRWLGGRAARMRGHLLPWAPVFLGAGIAIWFALPFEPGLPLYAVLSVTALGCGALALRGAELLHPLAAALFWLALGLLACGFRAHMVAAPMLDFRFYGAVTGRVVEIDRSQSDALRVTLDRVVLERTAPARTPVRVRLSLHGASPGPPPQPGQVVMATAHLAAPAGPVEPGGFDFRRMAFFDGLGAVGYSTAPLMLWDEAAAGTQSINRLRMQLSSAIQRAIPGQPGAFAAGAMTGDRSAITAETAQALRDSSLAHILAISGMNLAFLVSFTFALLRYGVALLPPFALRVDARKLAAVVALAVALFYLLLSGANVATERAFLMVAVMLGAVLCDRRALSLRSVALSALVLLLWQPESLLEPGFQMSFAATVALVAGFSAVARVLPPGRVPRLLAPLLTAVLSTLIGGIATAPFAAAHFNRFADLGFIANLLTVPAMGLLIMPGGVLAGLLTPLGLAAPAYAMMQAGSGWILFVAHRIAAVEGAVTGIPGPPAGVLAALSLGALWLVLIPGRLRLAGLGLVALALLAWAELPRRPALLISGEGGLAGLMGPEGRAISAPRGAGFVVGNWLQNDGDLVPQEEAAKRQGFEGPKAARRFQLNGWQGVVLGGTPDDAALDEACRSNDLVVAGEFRVGAVVAKSGTEGTVAPASRQAGREERPSAPKRAVTGTRPAALWPPQPRLEGCILFDAALFARTGALALDPMQDGSLRVTPANREGRIWAGRGARDQGARITTTILMRRKDAPKDTPRTR